MRTSCARGGATSTSSIFRGSPAPQQTAALHVMGFPAVSDMVIRKRAACEGRRGGKGRFYRNRKA